MAGLDLKSVALKKEAYANFTAAIADAPVPKLWDLLEEAFGGSNIEDGIEEEGPETELLAKRLRSEPSSMTTSAVSPETTIPRATASTTPYGHHPQGVLLCSASGESALV